MNNRTKNILIKMVIYVIVGFAVAFMWHKMRG
jgi:hypothetical protein